MNNEPIHTSPPGDHAEMKLFLADCLKAGDGMEFLLGLNWSSWTICNWYESETYNYRRIPKPAPTVRYPQRDLPKPLALEINGACGAPCWLYVRMVLPTPADTEAHKAAILEMMGRSEAWIRH